MYHINNLHNVEPTTLVPFIAYLFLPPEKNTPPIENIPAFLNSLKNLGINTLLLDERKKNVIPYFEELLRGGEATGFNVWTQIENLDIHFLLKSQDYQDFKDFKNIQYFAKTSCMTLGDARTIEQIILPKSGHFYNECIKLLTLLMFSHHATPCLCAVNIFEPKEKYAHNALIRFYQNLIAIRKENQVFTKGVFQDICPEHEKLWLFTRTLDKEQWLIVANFSIDYVIFDLPKYLKIAKKIFVLSNYGIGGKKGRGAEAVASLRLRPFEARLYELK